MTRWLLIINFTFFIGNSSEAASLKLKPFETDGCTLFIDGTPRQPGLWRPCCVEHDLRYWFGGSKEDMDQTDFRLKACVQNVAGEQWARTIYTGVRAGHYSPIKNKFAWNWGWFTKREKSPLTNEEIKIIQSELRLLRLEQENINMDDFIKVNFPQPKSSLVKSNNLFLAK